MIISEYLERKNFDREQDKQLKDKPHNNPDSNIQYIVNKELNNGIKTFNATGAAALLIDVNNGDIILVSLPNYNINQRETIKDKKYINKVTKGVYDELILKHLQLR